MGKENTKIITIDEKQYRLSRMSAILQMKIIKRITPLIAGIFDEQNDDVNITQLITKIQDLSDHDLEFIIHTCLQHTQFIDESKQAWPLITAGKEASWVNIVIIMHLIREHFIFNFLHFFDSVQQLLPQSENQTSDIPQSNTTFSGSSNQS